MEDNHVTPMPRIGDKAPEFKAVTTQGPINFPADYSGSWVILFSHPADFTPVCTSEFMTFASMEKQFRRSRTANLSDYLLMVFTAILHGFVQLRRRLNTRE